MRKGWEIKKLGVVCEIINGSTPLKSNKEFWDNGDFPWFTIDDIREQGRIIRYTKQKVTNAALKKLRVLPCETILLCCTASIGEFAITNIELTSNQQFNGLVVKNKKEVLPMFLYYFSSTLKGILFNLSGKTTIDFISIAKIKEIQIPIPPLPEQQRIVSILDEAFSSIEQAKENLQCNLQNAKELFQSELNNIFTNKGEGWEEKTLGEVCDELFAGGDAPKENFSSEKTEINNIPIYANAVKDKGLYGFTNYARVTKPSISIAARGSGTGHTFLRQGNYFPIVRLIVVIPNTELIDLCFLKLAIDTLVIIRSGSAIPQLTIPMIKNYTIPFPSLETQQKIVQQLDKLSTETKRLEAMYQQKLDSLEELKKSILQKAFSGELSN